MAYWFVWAVSGAGQELDNATSTAEQAGTAIGASIVMTVILLIWICGAVVGGISVFLTRPVPTAGARASGIRHTKQSHAVIHAGADLTARQSDSKGIRIPFSRMRVGILLTVVLGLFVAGVVLLWSGVLAGSVRGRLLGFLVPIILPVLLCVAVLYLRKALGDLSTAVIITERGITDNTTLAPHFFLPWSAVRDIREKVFGGRRVLALNLESPQVLVNQLPGWAKPIGEWAAQYGFFTTDNDYLINSLVLSAPYESLKAAVVSQYNVFRRDSGLSAAEIPYEASPEVFATSNPVEGKYAAFAERAVALLLDASLLFLPVALASEILCGVGIRMFGPASSARLESAVPNALWMTYFAVCHSSGWQATIGKRVLGLVVVGEDGARISMPRAVARYALLLVSALPVGVGFLMAMWTRRHQALHDMCVKTVVIKASGTSSTL
jgi:uncharacterized RDD family membrane protein YckC